MGRNVSSFKNNLSKKFVNVTTSPSPLRFAYVTSLSTLSRTLLELFSGRDKAMATPYFSLVKSLNQLKKRCFKSFYISRSFPCQFLKNLKIF